MKSFIGPVIILVGLLSTLGYQEKKNCHFLKRARDINRVFKENEAAIDACSRYYRHQPNNKMIQCLNGVHIHNELNWATISDKPTFKDKIMSDCNES